MNIERIFVFSTVNIITLSRGVLALGSLYELTQGNLEIANLLMALGFVTDLVDGKFARKFNVASEFGRINDRLNDAIFVPAMALLLTYNITQSEAMKHLILPTMLTMPPIWFTIITGVEKSSTRK